MKWFGENMAQNNNWFETSEDLLMPLPLTDTQIDEVVDEEALTEESVNSDISRRIYPSLNLPNNMNITVIPIIPGITLFGYIRFFNASPGEQRVDVYVNGRKIATSLLYRDFTEYMKVFPGWYRVAVFAAGTRTNPLTVTNIQVLPNQIYTAALIGLTDETDLQVINDTRRVLNPNRAYVRFVQLSPNAPQMDAYWDDALVVSELDYQDVSRYLATSPGTHNLKMRDTLSGANLVEHPNIELEGGKAYTIYVVGDLYDRTGLQIIIPLEGTTYLQF